MLRSTSFCSVFVSKIALFQACFQFSQEISILSQQKREDVVFKNHCAYVALVLMADSNVLHRKIINILNPF